MRIYAVGIVAVLIMQSASAAACMTDPYPEALIFDGPPSNPPPGYSLIKVIARHDRNSGVLRVKVTSSAQVKRIGSEAFLSAPASSCTDWGRVGREGYVVAKVDGRRRGKALLFAKSYRRSLWDRLWHYLGQTRFTPTGKPLGSFRSSGEPQG